MIFVVFLQGVGLLGCFALSCFPFGSFWLFLSFCLGFSFDRILFGSVFGFVFGFLVSFCDVRDLCIVTGVGWFVLRA